MFTKEAISALKKRNFFAQNFGINISKDNPEIHLAQFCTFVTCPQLVFKDPFYGTFIPIRTVLHAVLLRKKERRKS